MLDIDQSMTRMLHSFRKEVEDMKQAFRLQHIQKLEATRLKLADLLAAAAALGSEEEEGISIEEYEIRARAHIEADNCAKALDKLENTGLAQLNLDLMKVQLKQDEILDAFVTNLEDKKDEFIIQVLKARTATAEQEAQDASASLRLTENAVESEKLSQLERHAEETELTGIYCMPCQGMLCCAVLCCAVYEKLCCWCY